MGMFPVVYDAEKGHDYLLFAKLLKEADYYCLERLAAWIKEKKYEKAVRSKWTMTREGESKQFYTMPVRFYPSLELCKSMSVSGACIMETYLGVAINAAMRREMNHVSIGRSWSMRLLLTARRSFSTTPSWMRTNEHLYVMRRDIGSERMCDWCKINNEDLIKDTAPKCYPS